MILKVDTGSGSLELAEAEDFGGLHLEIPAGTAFVSPSLAEALEGVAVIDGDYAWVFSSALERLAGARDADWKASYAAMLAYAYEKGWVRGEPVSLRAHIEHADR